MPTGTLLLELGTVALMLSVVARVAGALRISPIPLYVLAGLALGEGGLLPLVTAEEFLEIGAELGVVLLLLMLGVEYAGDQLLRGLRAAAPMAAVDLVLNLGAGVVAGVVLGLGPVGALALGGVTYASSSGMVAKLVDEFGWLGNRETPSVLSLLVSEDLLMAVYLPVLGALLLGGPGAETGGQLVLALGAVAVALVVAVRFGDLVSRWLFTDVTEAMLLGALGLALLVAGLAAQLQVSAAVGAFLAGIAISGPAQELSRQLLRPLRDLFAAIFFIFFSLTIHPADIPPVLLPALVLALVTGATKYVTAVWGTRRQGIGARGRRRAGLVLLPRGEFSIIVAEIAIAAGLDPVIRPLAATYVLLLTISGPVLVRVLTRPQLSQPAS